MDILTYVAQGMIHIFTSYHHLLFLLCLLLPFGRTSAYHRYSFRYLFACVTSFTLAHLLSLTFGFSDAPPLAMQFIEFCIAVSIIIAAANVLQEFCPSMLMLSLIFGAMHGLGFGVALQITGFPGEQSTTTLLSLSLGVELAQSIVVCSLLPILSFLRTRVQHNERLIAQLASIILAIGTYSAAIRVV